MFSSNARITILTRQTGHIEDCRNFQEFNQHKKRADNVYFAGLPESFGEAYSWLPPRQILLLQTISLSTVVGGTYKVRRIQININYGHRRIWNAEWCYIHCLEATIRSLTSGRGTARWRVDWDCNSAPLYVLWQLVRVHMENYYWLRKIVITSDYGVSIREYYHTLGGVAMQWIWCSMSSTSFVAFTASWENAKTNPKDESIFFCSIYVMGNWCLHNHRILEIYFITSSKRNSKRNAIKHFWTCNRAIPRLFPCHHNPRS